MKGSDVNAMIDMKENGKSYGEIAEAFNISVHSAKYHLYGMHRYSDFQSQFDIILANRLARAEISTKEELYDLVSKHGYIRHMGPKLVEKLNEVLDRKITVMPERFIDINSIYTRGYEERHVYRLGFKDEEDQNDD